MIISNIIGENSRIGFTKDELVAINNSFNEICNGFDVKNFESRIGITEDAAITMLRFFGSTIDTMDIIDKEIRDEQ